jgi:hypothetical protein
MEKIKEKILAIINKKKQAMIFFPIGLGKHVDHVLAQRVGLHFPQDVVFYSDFPYCLSDREGEAILQEKGFTKGEFDKHLVRKNTLIKKYKTQHLFSEEPLIIPENYCFSKDLLLKCDADEI